MKKNVVPLHSTSGGGGGGAVKLRQQNGADGASAPVLGSDYSRARAAAGQRGFQLKPELLIRLHDQMTKARLLEERLIKMFKKGDGYFWIGGPGEEAFNVPLGLLVKKGQGPENDYLHLHYRSSGIMTAMGMDPLDAIRQMKCVATDPFSGGRNFCNHYSRREWNVVPVASTIENQYVTAIGTAIAQKHGGGRGITIVNGGDAGTAEGDFASCLVWSSRPGQELPILIIVVNNAWGISTAACTQHGERAIADRAKGFGIRTAVVDGNDVEESYVTLQNAMEYIRTERKPFMIEAHCARMYGHSSATGANVHGEEFDCLKAFEARLEKEGVMKRKEMDALRARYEAEMAEMGEKVRQEPFPDGSSIYDFTYFGQRGKYWK